MLGKSTEFLGEKARIFVSTEGVQRLMIISVFESYQISVHMYLKFWSFLAKQDPVKLCRSNINGFLLNFESDISSIWPSRLFSFLLERNRRKQKCIIWNDRDKCWSALTILATVQIIIFALLLRSLNKISEDSHRFLTLRKSQTSDSSYFDLKGCLHEFI